MIQTTDVFSIWAQSLKGRCDYVKAVNDYHIHFDCTYVSPLLLMPRGNKIDLSVYKNYKI